MKTKKTFLTILIIILSIGIFSCSGEGDSSSPASDQSDKTVYDVNTDIATLNSEGVSANDDTIKPEIEQFKIIGDTTVNNRTINIDFTGKDNIGITGWIISESSTTPEKDDSSWLAAQPGTFDLSPANGSKNIYAWIKDASGNLSRKAIINLILDTTSPVISQFQLPDSNTTTIKDITFIINAADATSGISGWLINESSAVPDINDSAWTKNKPYKYTLSTGLGGKTVYSWVKDNAGNISSSQNFPVTLSDGTAPSISEFKLALTSSNPTGTLSISIVIAASDDSEGTGINKWLIKENSATPLSADPLWNTTAIPSSYTLSSGDGYKSLYLWVMDNAENISESKTFSIQTINTSIPDILTAFSLISPTPASSKTAVLPGFSWNASDNAENYILQISTSLINFSADLIVNKTVSNTSTTLMAADITALTELVKNTTYYWKVIAKKSGSDDMISSPTPYSFTTVTEDSTTPVKVPPGDFNITGSIDNNASGINYNQNITFNWNASADATGYLLKIATDRSFNNIIKTIPLANVITYTLPVAGNGLLEGNDYYWQVISFNTDGTNIAENSPYKFNTNKPAEFELIAPVKEKFNVTTTPALEWEAADYAKHFTIEIDDDDDFSSISKTFTNITETSYTLSTALANGKFFWRVIAVNDVGEQISSEAYTFYTELYDGNEENPDITWNDGGGGVFDDVINEVDYGLVDDMSYFKTIFEDVDGTVFVIKLKDFVDKVTFIEECSIITHTTKESCETAGGTWLYRDELKEIFALTGAILTNGDITNDDNPDMPTAAFELIKFIHNDGNPLFSQNLKDLVDEITNIKSYKMEDSIDSLMVLLKMLRNKPAEYSFNWNLFSEGQELEDIGEDGITNLISSFKIARDIYKNKGLMGTCDDDTYDNERDCENNDEIWTQDSDRLNIGFLRSIFDTLQDEQDLDPDYMHNTVLDMHDLLTDLYTLSSGEKMLTIEKEIADWTKADPEKMLITSFLIGELTCTDLTYTNQTDCENNSETWDYIGLYPMLYQPVLENATIPPGLSNVDITDPLTFPAFLALNLPQNITHVCSIAAYKTEVDCTTNGGTWGYDIKANIINNYKIFIKRGRWLLDEEAKILSATAAGLPNSSSSDTSLMLKWLFNGLYNDLQYYDHLEDVAVFDFVNNDLLKWINEDIFGSLNSALDSGSTNRISQARIQDILWDGWTYSPTQGSSYFNRGILRNVTGDEGPVIIMADTNSNDNIHKSLRLQINDIINGNDNGIYTDDPDPQGATAWKKLSRAYSNSGDDGTPESIIEAILTNLQLYLLSYYYSPGDGKWALTPEDGTAYFSDPNRNVQNLFGGILTSFRNALVLDENGVHPDYGGQDIPMITELLYVMAAGYGVVDPVNAPGELSLANCLKSMESPLWNSTYISVPLILGINIKVYTIGNNTIYRQRNGAGAWTQYTTQHSMPAIELLQPGTFRYRKDNTITGSWHGKFAASQGDIIGTTNSSGKIITSNWTTTELALASWEGYGPYTYKGRAPNGSDCKYKNSYYTDWYYIQGKYNGTKGPGIGDYQPPHGRYHVYEAIYRPVDGSIGYSTSGYKDSNGNNMPAIGYMRQNSNNGAYSSDSGTVTSNVKVTLDCPSREEAIRKNFSWALNQKKYLFMIPIQGDTSVGLWFVTADIDIYAFAGILANGIAGISKAKRYGDDISDNGKWGSFGSSGIRTSHTSGDYLIKALQTIVWEPESYLIHPNEIILHF